MKTTYIKYLIILVAALTFISCEDLVDGINENPNQLTLEAVDPGRFLNGVELANIDIQLGYINRVAGFYTGQLIGYEQVEKVRYEYTLTSGTFDWTGYHGVIAPIREIQARTIGNPLYQGITRVLEANLIGTYASLFGDVPYSEAVSNVGSPKFDDQIEVFKSLQTILTEAIGFLNSSSGHVVVQDYIFSGNATKWLQTAWTLKARFYMYTKEYDLAYAAAQKGISAPSNNMKFTPMNTDGSTKNKYFLALSNAFTVGTGNCYLIQLLDKTKSVSRNNAKTNEEARLAYYTINHQTPANNVGIAGPLEPQPIVTYQENQLILAEAGTRISGFAIGLGHLNTYRSTLSTGSLFNSSVSSLSKKYDPYVDADFDAGGMENLDKVVPTRALLREIIEERYVSGFTTFMPYDDTRRLKKSDSDIAVPFPLNVPTATKNVERFIYPADETESNKNAPDDPGLYSVTKVNAK